MRSAKHIAQPERSRTARQFDALEAERKLVCEAYGVVHNSMAKATEQYCGFKSNTFYETRQNPVYRSFPACQPDVRREWDAVDLPYARVPCVQLAEWAGIAVPLHRAFAEILGVLLGVDPWACGPSLADMWTLMARRAWYTSVCSVYTEAPGAPIAMETHEKAS